MGPPLVTRQVSNLLVVHFIGRLSLEAKPRPRSWPTLSIVSLRPLTTNESSKRVFYEVWLRAKETEISAALWALWLGKEF